VISLEFNPKPGKNLARKCESVSENKKSELLALAHTLTLFVVPSPPCGTSALSGLRRSFLIRKNKRI
jgi:hypothetical protein